MWTCKVYPLSKRYIFIHMFSVVITATQEEIGLTSENIQPS